jgi:hypothetical protein
MRPPLARSRHPAKRWQAVAAAVLGAFLSVFDSQPVLAEAVAVPAALQADVLAKLVKYDRNFAARAGQMVQVVLVTKSSATSTLSAAAMKSALERLEVIGGLPHRQTVVPYTGAAALAKRCREEHAAIVYVTPDFQTDIEALRAALTGVDVLTVSAVPDYVPNGIVLGFELVSGKPQLILNLTQARQQNINFKADVLPLMKVYR